MFAPAPGPDEVCTLDQGLQKTTVIPCAMPALPFPSVILMAATPVAH